MDNYQPVHVILQGKSSYDPAVRFDLLDYCRQYHNLPSSLFSISPASLKHSSYFDRSAGMAMH